MSAWLNIVRQVYQAGGRMPVARVYDAPSAITEARRLGLLEPGVRGQGRRPHTLALTQRGVDLMEGRVAPRVLPYSVAFNAGRLPGTGRKWCPTWLAALPRANEVRLTGVVHRAQNDGTCYW